MKGINQKDRGIRVAAAPINRGVTGLDPANLDPDDVLDTVVSTGYDGSELGPLGYLATTEEDLQHRFAPRQLDLASAFVAVSLAVPIGRSAAEDFRAVLRLLAAGGSARVLVSDAASDDRLAVAGRVSAHPETSWSDTDWIQAVQTLAELAAIAAEHGLGLACHPHAGSHLESAGEIARLLESTDPQTVALCLDTGHAIIGGADPVELLHAVGTRTVHVHAKDVDPALLEQLRNGAMTYTEAVGAGMQCDLGNGVVDWPGIASKLRALEYAGWIVVEQDRPLAGAGDAQPVASLRRNRAFLRDLLEADSAR